MKTKINVRIAPDNLARLIRINGWLNKPSFATAYDVMDHLMKMTLDGQADISVKELIGIAEEIVEWTDFQCATPQRDLVADVANELLAYSSVKVEIL